MAANCQQLFQGLHHGLDEYMCSSAFWTLGILVVINGIWVEEQYDQYMDLDRQAKFDSIQSPAAATLLAKRKPARFFWLQPHITSPLRKFLAILACTLALLLLLLELSWMYKAAWGLTAAVFQKTCASSAVSQDQPLLTRYSLCLPVAAVGLVAWYFFVKRSLILVFSQLSYILQLNSLGVDAPLELRGKAPKPDTASRTPEPKN